eukprot:823297-Pelagomonas_calceolata.AAC.1
MLPLSIQTFSHVYKGYFAEGPLQGQLTAIKILTTGFMHTSSKVRGIYVVLLPEQHNQNMSGLPCLLVRVCTHTLLLHGVNSGDHCPQALAYDLCSAAAVHSVSSRFMCTLCLQAAEVLDRLYKREVTSLSKLSHPNIVQLLAVGRVAP